MQGSIILDCFHYCKATFRHKKKKFIFFLYFCIFVFFKMKLKNFLVGSFLSGIGLVIDFHLQRAFTKILESFEKTNRL